MKTILALALAAQMASSAAASTPCFVPSKAARVQLALGRLAAIHPKPRTGDEAYRRLAAVLRAVEKDFFPAEVVDAAFLAYDYTNGESEYDENAHPKIFSEIVKPPARRYRWKGAPADREVICQLDHITIFFADGTTEVQRIDPARRARLASPTDPLVLAILGDEAYFEDLPNRRDLVLFRR